MASQTTSVTTLTRCRQGNATSDRFAERLPQLRSRLRRSADDHPAAPTPRANWPSSASSTPTVPSARLCAACAAGLDRSVGGRRYSRPPCRARKATGGHSHDSRELLPQHPQHRVPRRRLACSVGLTDRGLRLVSAGQGERWSREAGPGVGPGPRSHVLGRFTGEVRLFSSEASASVPGDQGGRRLRKICVISGFERRPIRAPHISLISLLHTRPLSRVALASLRPTAGPLATDTHVGRR
jgi:hypothetical protein